MEEERTKISFDVEKLTNFLDGGPQLTARRRQIISAVIKNINHFFFYILIFNNIFQQIFSNVSSFLKLFSRQNKFQHLNPNYFIFEQEQKTL